MADSRESADPFAPPHAALAEPPVAAASLPAMIPVLACLHRPVNATLAGAHA